MNTSFGVGMGMEGLGGVMGSVASLMEQQAMEQAFRDELNRQLQLQSQATQTWNQNLPNSGPASANRQIQQGANTRMEAYKSAPALLAGQGQQPNAPQVGAALQLGGQARAQMGGYGDWELNQKINNIRAQEQLNQISNASKGYAGVFPMQMAQAQQSWGPLSFGGQATSNMGQSLGLMGMMSQPSQDQYGRNPDPMISKKRQNNPNNWMDYTAPSGSNQLT